MVAVVEQPKRGHSKAAVIHDKRRTELVPSASDARFILSQENQCESAAQAWLCEHHLTLSLTFRERVLPLARCAHSRT